MNLALFDFDGTITHADSFTPFVCFAVPRARVVLGALALAPLILGYKLGWISGTRMRSAIVRVGFWGRKRADVLALGAEYSRTRIAPLLRPEMLERIAWHRERGDTVVIVSASLAAYLRPWCNELGLELICSELELRGERLTGRYANGDCTAHEKARRVRERYELASYPVIYAYGDTAEDREMLGLAHERFFRGKLLTSLVVAE